MPTYDFLDFKEFYFARQTKRWKMLIEAVPSLRNCSDGELDVICDLLKASFKGDDLI